MLSQAGPIIGRHVWHHFPDVGRQRQQQQQQQRVEWESAASQCSADAAVSRDVEQQLHAASSAQNRLTHLSFGASPTRQKTAPPIGTRNRGELRISYVRYANFAAAAAVSVIRVLAMGI
jgi:hypothetical protein